MQMQIQLDRRRRRGPTSAGRASRILPRSPSQVTFEGRAIVHCLGAASSPPVAGANLLGKKELSMHQTGPSLIEPAMPVSAAGIAIAQRVE